MYELHDPHKTPEPILVLSGLTYLVPAWVALQKDRTYDFVTYTFLTFTTTGFHSTRSDTLFALDCLAILNFLGRSMYLSTEVDTYTRSIYAFSVIYSLTSYFVGQRYKIMSFHPDWNTQMAYHSLMHLSTAYSAYMLMTQV